MSSFTKNYDKLMGEIVTCAFLFPNYRPGEMPEYKFYSENVGWDTGAEYTIVAPYIVEGLKLTPIGKEPINGIGGLSMADTYIVSLGLPNGHVIHDFKIYCIDIEDYDILIGMDVIQKTDFAITNNNGKTTFSFQIPSSTTIDF